MSDVLPRRSVLLALASACLGSACGGGGGGSTTATSPPGACGTSPGTDTITLDAVGGSELTIDANVCGTAVNPYLRGSNIQWVDGGDNLLQANSRTPATDMTALSARVAPTVLRYPGGELADLFRWEQANNLTLTGAAQATWMDSDRFRAFCLARGAEPLITVNISTGTAQEAARWVTDTNLRVRLDSDGRRLPTVRYWELGNEPYFDSLIRPGTKLTPAQYASRVNDFIRAMRAADPTIVVGLPLSNDDIQGVRILPDTGFADTVLSLVTERFDYVTLHNAYMPYAFTADAGTLAALSQRDAYLAAMGAARTVMADTERMRQKLRAARPNQTIPIAITEYHGLLTFVDTGVEWQTRWPLTPAAALYVADLFATMSRQPDLLALNQWSLSGNGTWGAIQHGTDTATAFLRPTGLVLETLARVWQGEWLPATLRTQPLSTPAIGLSAAQTALPVLQTLTTRQAGGSSRTLKTMLINKHPDQAQRTTVRVRNGGLRTASGTRLQAADLFDVRDVEGMMTESAFAASPDSTGAITLNLPAHSITVLTLELTS